MVRDKEISNGGQQVSAVNRRFSGDRTLAEHVFEHSPDLIKVLDAEGRVLFTNDADVRHPSDSHGIRKGMLWAECWPDESAAIVSGAVDAAVRGQRTRFNAYREASTGEQRWFDVLVSPFSDKSGGQPLVLAVSRDVTERHQLEKELRRAKEDAEVAARARADFLATMSHELRTPLAGIISNLELVEIHALPSKEAVRVRQVQEASEALLRIVNDVLDIARIEADGLPMIEQPFDIASLVNDTVSLIGPIASQKGLRLTHRVDQDRAQRLRGDAGRLRQVLINLVGNAVKFTPTGKINLEVRTRAKRDGRVALNLKVADTGIGISQDTRDLLYKRFAQLDPSIKHRFGGTGLGLAISRHIIERMGGEISVESVPGAGTTFSIDLDLAAADCPGSEPQEICSGGASTIDVPSFDLSVLVVDDDALHREVTSELLRRMGCRVEVAVDGRDALSALGRQTFDIVLLDQQMPGLSGVETARLIRASTASITRPRLVACTANVFGVPDHESSFDECLIKPVTQRSLSPVLRRAAPVDPPGEDGLFHLLPPATATALVADFRIQTQRLATAIGQTGAAPTNEFAALAHKLISSARILEFTALALALQRAEAALLKSEVIPAEIADELRRQIEITLADRKIMDPEYG